MDLEHKLIVLQQKEARLYKVNDEQLLELVQGGFAHRGIVDSWQPVGTINMQVPSGALRYADSLAKGWKLVDFRDRCLFARSTESLALPVELGPDL